LSEADDFDRLRVQLARRIGEGEHLELKNWIRPDQPSGIAAIAKACIALYNANGGDLYLGFTNRGLPDYKRWPSDVHAIYTQDALQEIVSRFAALPFEVVVRFVAPPNDAPQREFPVVVVPKGVQVPVASKSGLRHQGEVLVREHAVYVRSLYANLRISTTEARQQDWSGLIDRCLRNRARDTASRIEEYLKDSLVVREIQQIRHLLQRIESRLDERG
jgi:hypothetical protein